MGLSMHVFFLTCLQPCTQDVHHHGVLLQVHINEKVVYNSNLNASPVRMLGTMKAATGNKATMAVAHRGWTMLSPMLSAQDT
mmetsp:Transcript_13417/g.28708  ORF Transcript_13417/g.28708 Transcript_13417/m.28708 type:complete len:82 (+) Transcript_13417:799-1044(+)